MAKSGENIALEWTRAELLQTLESARRTLETFAEARADGADAPAESLGGCVADLHQAHGVFVMLELQCAATFAAHLEAVVAALAEGSLSDPDGAAESVMQGLLELPEYLDAQRSGLGDTIVPLLPVLNDLRVHLRKPPLASPHHEAAFATAPEPAVLARFTALEGLDKVRKVRAVYQQVLLSVLKGGVAAGAVETLDKVAISMQRLCENTPQGVLWQAFGEYLQALRASLGEQPGALGAEAIKLLRRMDSELRALAQEGTAALSRPVPVDLLQLLVGAARGRGHRSEFLDDLEQSLSASDVSEALVSSGRRALASAAAALRDDLAGVRDQIDLLLRGALGDGGDTTGHEGLLAPLKQIGSTMALLGLESSRALVAEQLDALTAPVVDAALLESTAEALAQVDQNLASLCHGGKSDAELILDTAQQAVIAEARRGLELLKQGVVDYVSSQWDARHLQALPEALTGISQALRMIPLLEAATLVDQCLAYVVEDLLEGHVPDWVELDQFAGVVSGVDYYLERVAGPSAAGADEILEFAQRGMTELRGRAPQAPAAVAFVEPAGPVEPAAPMVPVAAQPAEFAEPLVAEPESVAAEVAEPVPEPSPAAFGLEAPEGYDEAAAEPEIEVDLLAVEAELSEPELAEAELAEPERAEPSSIAETDTVAEVAETGTEAETSGAVVPTGPDAVAAAAPPRAAAPEVLQRLAALEDEFEVDDDILAVFLEEVDEVLAVVDERLPPWARDLGEGQHAVELRRAFHTLKGSGRLVGARVLGELAWAVEQMLNRVIDGTIDATPELQAVIAAARQLVPGLRQAFAERRAPDLGEVAAIVTVADRIAAGAALAADELPAAEELWEPAALPAVDEQLSTEPLPAAEEPPAVEAFFEPAAYAGPQALSEDTQQPEPEAQTAAEPAAGDAAVTPLEAVAPPEPVTPPAAEAPVDTRLVFREEAAEHLAVIARAHHAEGWRLDEAVARALHTLAGSAAMVGIPVVAELARAALEVVQALLGSRESVDLDEGAARFLAQAHGALAADLEAIAGGAPLYPHTDLLDEAERLRHETPVAPLIQDMLQLPGFDLLLAAQDLLEDWARGAFDAQRHGPLAQVLRHIGELAAAPEYAPLAELAVALAAAHERLAGGALEPLAAEALLTAHERLLGQIDALVAGQPLRAAGEALAVLGTLERAVPEPVGEPAAEPEPPAAAAEPAEIPAQPAEAVQAVEDAYEVVDPELVGIFLEEADELLDQMDRAVQACTAGDEVQAAIEALLRALHTLKGGARLAGLVRAGDCAHDFESWLIAVRDAGAGFDPAARARLHAEYDGLATLIAAAGGAPGADSAATVEAPEPAPLLAVQPEPTLADEAAPASGVPWEQAEAPSAPTEPVAAELEPAPAAAAVAADQAAPSMAVQAALAERRPAETAADRGPEEVVRVRASLLDQLVNLAGESSIIRGRVQQGLAEFGGALDEMETTIQRLREQLRRLEIETEAQILFRRERTDGPGYEEFDPLEFDRYSQLQQLSRSLSESASDMLDLKDTLRQRAGETEALLVQQSRISTQLQEGLMRSRMVPFARLLPRLRRTVRQVAQDLGKSVELLAYNIEGELDRSLLDRMIAPLEHMLRNAVDHGIESAEQRRAAGKPETGTIELRLAREAGDVVIEIRDDGAGIDLERVRAKAIAQGLMREDSDLSDDEIRQFIFAPGFSTARSLTQISGRGVGMDVAHSAVKQLGGSIGLASEPGRGTAFLLRVPFTVSVNRALMVSVGEDLYAVPLNTIEGVVLLRGDEIADLGSASDPSIEYAGIVYQVRHLGEYLGRSVRPGTSANSMPVVLVRSGDRAVAVQVDAVQGSREIVVKGLGPQFAGVAGVSGATILGDGGVVVILDLPALVRERRERPTLERKRGAAKSRARSTVLVVDDSVTVRKVTSRLLERQGMEVLLAKDGVEAVAALQERKPDIMLLDIEMPRMDGFEVLRHVRHDSRLADLPVVMISSRTGAKHKERAAELGVSHFLGKPFQETELLAVIDRFLSDSPVTEAMA